MVLYGAHEDGEIEVFLYLVAGSLPPDLSTNKVVKTTEHYCVLLLDVLI